MASGNKLLTLSKGVYLLKPVNSATRLSTQVSDSARPMNEPNVILLFSWMGARLTHLTKYSNTYTELYPGATQILVRCEASFFWSSQASRGAYLEPAVEALESLGCLTPVSTTTKSALAIPSSPSILVHAFSNGGASQLATLGEILSSRHISSPNLLPTSALVLDSCPGDGGVQGTILAFSSAVQNPLLKGVIKFIIRLLHFCLSLQRRITGSSSETILDKIKAKLNNRRLLPWFDKDTPRLYLYSIEDKLIPYQDIETHAHQAKQSGFPVTMEKFEDSPHVAHAKVYPQRYWTAIQKLWDHSSESRSKIVDHSRTLKILYKVQPKSRNSKVAYLTKVPSSWV